MLVFTRKLKDRQNATRYRVLLNHEDRQRTRLRIVTMEGTTAGIQLARGERLDCGDVLSTDDGDTLLIEGQEESLSQVRSDGIDLAKACYHLGNRHVPVLIEDDGVFYRCDHVLDQMMEQLGFSVERCQRVFSPERGAYHKH
ncbi:urease accessory protein UreE [Pseudobacteriovorax antillogorgiicola]|uniref:Urease accessory protein UreE n=1 Tax=Pseudobacteriovorax antillogorgiicola TaxID=1513793 RepID=A0A1Y6BD41_9BACT|nr:urease accessory protein UreE [Pseudobacteriovorax antillogorgiicola]TCS57296.1 urease accessory protein [Pseudobacteriovorax antillogorgiicola]SMF02976.1 urease accessory protein [Pseudobacteriovorax antillogorgiicola]